MSDELREMVERLRGVLRAFSIGQPWTLGNPRMSMADDGSVLWEVDLLGPVGIDCDRMEYVGHPGTFRNRLSFGSVGTITATSADSLISECRAILGPLGALREAHP